MSKKKQSVKALSADSVNHIECRPEDDIYKKEKEMQDIDPEDVTVTKAPNELNDIPDELDFSTNFDGDDLDVPGAELDDADEEIGEEDEENNYYSIGGDNHTEL